MVINTKYTILRQSKKTEIFFFFRNLCNKSLTNQTKLYKTKCFTETRQCKTTKNLHKTNIQIQNQAKKMLLPCSK